MRFYSLALALAALASLSACDTLDRQNDFRIAALQIPSGYTQTDESGSTTGTVDADDWRTAPIYGPASTTSIDVTPLYPNPSATSVTILLNVRTGGVVGGLRVVGYRERDGQLPQTYTLYNEPNVTTGLYALSFNPGIQPAFALGGGLRRIVVFDGQNDVVTYGDLMIE